MWFGLDDWAGLQRKEPPPFPSPWHEGEGGKEGGEASAALHPFFLLRVLLEASALIAPVLSYQTLV